MLRSLLLPTAALGATSLFVLSTPAPVTAAPAAAAASGFEGAVYAMTNDFVSNRIVAYGRRSDGTLELLGDFPTGGQGAAFDGGEGLDPLISAYAVLLTDDQDFLLAVNAGNNSLTAFRVTEDFRLRRTDIVRSGGFGPNSIAYRDGFVTVSNIDADGAFAGEPDQEGSLLSFRLTPEGKLRAIPGSRRILGNRPSAVQYTPDGQHLVVASINAGSAALASGSNDEIVSYGVDDFGRLTEAPRGAGASTLPFNTANRNLASAIGFEIVESGDRNFVVVTEAREFTSEGLPPTLPNLQTGSVSTWELLPDGSLDPLQLDVLAGTDIMLGSDAAAKKSSVFSDVNAVTKLATMQQTWSQLEEAGYHRSAFEDWTPHLPANFEHMSAQLDLHHDELVSRGVSESHIRRFADSLQQRMAWSESVLCWGAFTAHRD